MSSKRAKGIHISYLKKSLAVVASALATTINPKCTEVITWKRVLDSKTNIPYLFRSKNVFVVFETNKCQTKHQGVEIGCGLVGLRQAMRVY